MERMNVNRKNEKNTKICDGALVDHLEVSCKGGNRVMRGKYYIKVQKITIS